MKNKILSLLALSAFVSSFPPSSFAMEKETWKEKLEKLSPKSENVNYFKKEKMDEYTYQTGNPALDTFGDIKTITYSLGKGTRPQETANEFHVTKTKSKVALKKKGSNEEKYFYKATSIAQILPDSTLLQNMSYHIDNLNSLLKKESSNEILNYSWPYAVASNVLNNQAYAKTITNVCIEGIDNMKAAYQSGIEELINSYEKDEFLAGTTIAIEFPEYPKGIVSVITYHEDLPLIEEERQSED